jgi:hypothetical protein
MPRDTMSLDSDLEALVLELLTPRSHRKGTSRPNGKRGSMLTDALAAALAGTLSEASPLDRAVFIETVAPEIADALAPALADALAPKLAEALAPALATALGDFFSSRQSTPETESMEAARKHEKK